MSLLSLMGVSPLFFAPHEREVGKVSKRVLTQVRERTFIYIANTPVAEKEREDEFSLSQPRKSSSTAVFRGFNAPARPE